LPSRIENSRDKVNLAWRW